jgi:hypothetical protein
MVFGESEIRREVQGSTNERTCIRTQARDQQLVCRYHNAGLEDFKINLRDGVFEGAQRFSALCTRGLHNSFRCSLAEDLHSPRANVGKQNSVCT